MPIYEYRCSSCGHELESLQKFSDDPLVTCPSCGAATLVKQVSAAGFQLKGSGWYVTDFRGGAKAKTEGGASSEGAKGSDKPAAGDSKESKSDSASTATSDSKTDTSSCAAPPAKSGTTPATP